MLTCWLHNITIVMFKLFCFGQEITNVKCIDTDLQNVHVRVYRSGRVNSNTVNLKFHLIRSYYEIFFYHFPNIPCLKCTVNSNFHLIQSKILLTNDFELTVPNLYRHWAAASVSASVSAWSIIQCRSMLTLKIGPWPIPKHHHSTALYDAWRSAWVGILRPLVAEGRNGQKSIINVDLRLTS